METLAYIGEVMLGVLAIAVVSLVCLAGVYFLGNLVILRVRLWNRTKAERAERRASRHVMEQIRKGRAGI